MEEEVSLEERARRLSIDCAEYNLKTLPYRGKLLVPPVRDQGNGSTCFIHSACTCVESLNKRKGALAHPQEDFEVILSADDLEMSYAKLHGPIGKEEVGKSGFRRLLRTLEILRESGTYGIQAEEVCGPFKIRFSKEIEAVYQRRPTKRFLNPTATPTQDVKELLSRGNVLIGTFRISRNYLKLKPGEVYTYDEKIPEPVGGRGRASSHAVAIVGYGARGGVWYYIIQNSYGEGWGENGIGRVNVDSITHLVHVRI